MDFWSSLPPPAARPPELVRRLRTQSATLPFFHHMAAARLLNWEKTHDALMRESTVARARRRDLVFDPEASGAQPIVILSGEAMLLRNDGGDAVPLDFILRRGDCISKEVLMWLDPTAVALIATGDLLLLKLPSLAYSRSLKLPHLEHLIRYADLLGRVPVLRDCPAATLRALAMAGRGVLADAGAQIARQGAPCPGLIALTSGSITVTVEASTDESHRWPEAVAPERPIAHVSAPELIGSIDMARALGALRRIDPSGVDATLLGPTHGANVRCTAATEAILIPTDALLRHGAPIMDQLVREAADRGIIRDALSSEVERQVAEEASVARLREASSASNAIQAAEKLAREERERILQQCASAVRKQRTSSLKATRRSLSELEAIRSTSSLPESPTRRMRELAEPPMQRRVSSPSQALSPVERLVSPALTPHGFESDELSFSAPMARISLGSVACGRVPELA